MDVCCPSCETVYEVDERQFGGDRRRTLKCSNCAQLFQYQSNRDRQNEEGRRWMIRRENTGDILYCAGFDVLHEWLVEGRVTARDRISRTGNSWKTLGDIGELTPIFEVAESIADISGDDRARSRDETRRQVAPPVERDGLDGTDTAVDEGGSTPPQMSEEQQRGRGPGVQLEDRRFGSAEGADDTEEAVQAPEEHPAAKPTADEQTFGQLEHQREPDLEIARAATGRRWPWALVAGVALLVGAGVWQYDAIQQFADDVVAGGDRGEDQRPEAMEEMPSVDDEAKRRIAESLREARDAQYRAGMTGLVSDRADSLRDAVDVARQAASDAGEAREAAARGPSTVSGYIDAGRRARNRGATDDARRYFEEALEMSSGNAQALVGLGWTELSEGRDAQAVELFERARRQDPSASEALIGLGRAERNRGRQQAALDAYEEYLREFPGGDQASIAEYQSEQLRRAIDD